MLGTLFFVCVIGVVNPFEEDGFVDIPSVDATIVAPIAAIPQPRASLDESFEFQEFISGTPRPAEPPVVGQYSEVEFVSEAHLLLSAPWVNPFEE